MRAAEKESKPHCLQAAGDIWHHWKSNHIFRTDNRKEFTAKVLLEFLCNLNPNILTVTGRPRRPSDQGSVENMNKFVKRTLETVLAEYRLVGKHRNWTEVLGSIASAINLQHGRG
jgi:hypothetical protein